MKVKQPVLGDYFKLPNPSLRAYFRRTELGNSADYRPPFWKGISRPQVLEMWQRIVDSSGIKRKFPGLYSYEMEMKAKVGPMSIQLPLSLREKSIENYFATPNAEPILPEAIDATIETFRGIKGIRKRSKSETISNMRLSTNSGSPYFRKRKDVVDLPQDGYKYAAVLGWRGQEGGISEDDVKQRVIWMMPFLLNVSELQYYQPLIQAVQSLKIIPAYVSMDEVDMQVTKLFDSKPKDDDVICTDFSSFDQHFNPVMQEAARKVLSALGAQGIEDWLQNVFPVKFTLPLVCSEKLMYTGAHGMGSGSGGTNFDECLSHKALQHEAAITAGQRLNPFSMAYGDDGALTYPGITIEHVLETYTKHGQDMNKLKQMISKREAIVLRRWHSVDYRVNGVMVGCYATFRALGRLLAQERYYDPKFWNGKMVILRAWSILENCKWNPLFEDFVRFCIKGDRYRLGLSIPGFLDNIDKLVTEATSWMPDFLGYTKSQQSSQEGITSWRIYKYLRQLEKDGAF